MYKLIDGRDSGLIGETEKFNLSCEKGHFCQSVLWSRVKDNWDFGQVVAYKNGEISGILSLLFRRLPLGLSLMYAPRGPVCDVHDRETLSELFKGAAELAKKHRSYLFKIDPDVLSSDTLFDEEMKSFGFAKNADSKNFEGVQPRYVFRLAVGGKTEEELLASFESKTRYNLRLSVRKGVTVKYFSGDNDIPDDEISAFSELMEVTGERDRFMVRGKDYFIKLLRMLGANSRLYMAYNAEGERIAGTLAVHYGDKVWYLYGASANQHRNLMPNYQLQWEMMRWSLAEGCRIYDFRGVSGDLSEDNPLYGLYRFKKGFNGDFCEFAGEYNLAYMKLTAKLLDKAQALYKKLRYIRHMKKSGTAEKREPDKNE